MSIRLESAIAELATRFAREVVALIGGAQVSELVAIGGGGAKAARGAAPARGAAGAPVTRSAKKGGRLARRSSEEILKQLDRIVSTLRQSPGMRSEELQRTLGLSNKEIERPIAIGLANGALRKAGEKRSTKYFAGGGAKRAAAPAKKGGAKKGAAKRRGAKKGAKKINKKSAQPQAATSAESASS